jgi:hypothetical protein
MNRGGANEFLAVTLSGRSENEMRETGKMHEGEQHVPAESVVSGGPSTRFPSQAWFRWLWICCGAIVGVGLLNILDAMGVPQIIPWLSRPSLAGRIVAGAAILWMLGATIVDAWRSRLFIVRRSNGRAALQHPTLLNYRLLNGIGIGLMLMAGTYWLVVGTEQARLILQIAVGLAAIVHGVIEIIPMGADSHSRGAGIMWLIIGAIALWGTAIVWN